MNNDNTAIAYREAIIKLGFLRYTGRLYSRTVYSDGRAPTEWVHIWNCSAGLPWVIRRFFRQVQRDQRTLKAWEQANPVNPPVA